MRFTSESILVAEIKIPLPGYHIEKEQPSSEINPSLHHIPLINLHSSFIIIIHYCPHFLVPMPKKASYFSSTPLFTPQTTCNLESLALKVPYTYLGDLDVTQEFVRVQECLEASYLLGWRYNKRFLEPCRALWDQNQLQN